MKNLKISQKIGVLLFMLFLATAGLSAKLIFAMSAVNDQSTVIADNWLPSVESSAGLDTSLSDFRIAQMQHVGTTDPAIMKGAEEDLQTVGKQLAERMETYKKLISSEEEQNLFNQLNAQWARYMEAHKVFLSWSRENKNAEASTLLLGSMKKDFDAARAALDKIISLNHDSAGKASAYGDMLYASEKLQAFIGLGVLVVFSFFITLMLSRNIATRCAY